MTQDSVSLTGRTPVASRISEYITNVTQSRIPACQLLLFETHWIIGPGFDPFLSIIAALFPLILLMRKPTTQLTPARAHQGKIVRIPASPNANRGPVDLGLIYI
jgi:hypothetical protein